MHYAGCGDKVVAIQKDLNEYGYMGCDDGNWLQPSQPHMNVNAGVVTLATDHLNGTIMNNRLDIEDNIGEGIHIHYKNFRMDFTIKDFIKFAQACEESLTKLYSK